MKLPRMVAPISQRAEDCSRGFDSHTGRNDGISPSGFCDLPGKQCNACTNGTQTCVIPGTRYPAFQCPC